MGAPKSVGLLLATLSLSRVPARDVNDLTVGRARSQERSCRPALEGSNASVPFRGTETSTRPGRGLQVGGVARRGSCCYALGGMAATTKRIEANLARIRAEIAAACERVGRPADDVRIVAVTKAVDLAAAKNLIDAGAVDLGENRTAQLAERAEKIAAFLSRRRNGPDSVRWHMVGHLQRNKVKTVLGTGAVIHSVDSLRLAEEINNRAEAAGTIVDVLLQVNCSEEPQKSGVAVGAAAYLGELICTLKSLRLLGLMTMAPLVDDPEQARPTFTRLREIFEDMRLGRVGGEIFRHLSMGMSQDYQVAVEEGATILRIGTAIFE